MRTADAARDKWHGILPELGIDQKFLVNRHGPCPLCGGRDRFRFDNRDGKGTWFCNQCGSGDGMSLALKFTGQEFKSLASEIDKLVGTVSVEQRKVHKIDPSKRLNETYSRLQTISNTPVDSYLSSRGLSLPSSGLSYHSKLAYFEEGKFKSAHPAMVATFCDEKGKPISLHCTYLTFSGEKADLPITRKMMTPTKPLNGGAIRLSEHGELLGIAEGIETALAASQMFDIPVWASANATLLEAFNPPEGVKEVQIFGDHDRGYRGQSAAYRLANRLSLMGINVTVEIPMMFGDFNDVLLSEKERSIYLRA